MERYYLMDLERTLLTGTPCYWKSNKFGYTYKVEYAGLFSEDLAIEIARNDLDKKTVLVPEKLVRETNEHELGSESNERC